MKRGVLGGKIYPGNQSYDQIQASNRIRNKRVDAGCNCLAGTAPGI